MVYALNYAFIAQMVSYPMVPIAFYSFPPPFNEIGFMMVMMSWWVILLLFNVRNWMIYFKSHWTFNTVQLEWQQIINPEIKNQENWFLDKSQKYGKTSTIFKIFFIAHFIGFIMSVIGVEILKTGYLPGHATLLSAMGVPMVITSLLLPVIFYIYILCKTPTFQSCHVYIHWESKLQSKILVFAVISFMFTLTGGELVGVYISSSFGCPIMATIFFVLHYISTFLLIRKNISTNDGISEVINSTDDVIALDDILSDKYAVHLFMVYLTTEFSIECLLSFIEMSQFEQYILQMMKMNDDEDGHIDKLEQIAITVEPVICNSNVPQSSIIGDAEDNSDRLQNAKLSAHNIYNKYIRIGVDLEINISSTMRRKYRELLANENELIKNNEISLADLAVLFKPAKTVMRTYLQYSYVRFKNQSEYEQVMNLFVKRRGSKNTGTAGDDTQIVYKESM